MESLHERVIAALKTEFAGLVDGLETVDSTGRVTGFVVGPDFDGIDDKPRQDRLWKALRNVLEDNELRRVGPIVTLTPAEADIDVSVDEKS